MSVPTLTYEVGSRENREAKAVRLILERRLTIKLVHRGRVWAEVRGTDRVHTVGYTNGHWHCSCEAKRMCSHITALQYVTLKPGD